MLEPPRVEAVVPAHSPRRGPDDAPVTIIEYTDFQCPYCVRAQDTLDEVLERYGDQVRHVFKNLPLPMHKDAQMAAEAALCAQAQDRFWVLHDWMFENRNSLDRDTLTAKAGEFGLDAEAFARDVPSTTKGIEYRVEVSRRALQGGLAVLIVDDFLSGGRTAEALGEIGSPGPIKDLVAVADKIPDARLQAIESLGKIGHRDALDALYEYLESSDPMVMYVSIEAIGRIADQRSGSVLRHDPSPEIRVSRRRRSPVVKM